MITLTIGASRNKLIGSKILQWWMSTDYSHVYCRWHLSSQERDIIYQASHGMVHFCSLENFIKQNTIVKEFHIELTNEQFKKLSIKCVDLAGEKYSKIQLFQIFMSDVSNGKIKSKDQKGYICSELMCELLEEVGVEFDKPRHMITPKDIIKSLESHP